MKFKFSINCKTNLSFTLGNCLAYTVSLVKMLYPELIVK